MMNSYQELEEISTKIRLMHKLADDLSDKAERFPALARNLVRLKASVKMLELNISDVIDP